MESFFLHLLNKIEILTGIRQLERLQDKPAQLQELVDECVKASNQFPLKEEIMKSVLMDAVSSDPDFIGLNVKWVRKILNLYCQVHGVTKGAKEAEPIDLVVQYENLINFWKLNADKDPNNERQQFAKENLDRVLKGVLPIDDLKGIEVMAGMYAKQIEGTIFAQSMETGKGSGSKIRENLDEHGVKFDEKKHTPIETSSLEDFCEKKGEYATPNQEGKETTGADSEISESSFNPEQQKEDDKH